MEKTDNTDIMVYGTKNRKQAFTLAEALIVLVIIGVIAALTIPAILVNTEQHEYKTALRKAVAMLNQAIELNIALEGYGPIEVESGANGANMGTATDSLYNFFRKRMNVVTTSNIFNGGGQQNWAFYTADGMRYEFPTNPKTRITSGDWNVSNSKCARPPHMIADSELTVVDQSGTALTQPCLVIVDVNGDRKPNPQRTRNSYKVPAAANTSKLLDVYPIEITDVSATPFGLVGQRAMFSHK